MLIKFLTIIALGAALSFGGPTPSTNTKAGEETTHAFLSVCIGPMTMGFAPDQAKFFTLSFDASGHEAGLMGAFGVHVHTGSGLFKTGLLAHESDQKPPHRLPSLR